MNFSYGGVMTYCEWVSGEKNESQVDYGLSMCFSIARREEFENLLNKYMEQSLNNNWIE